VERELPGREAECLQLDVMVAALRTGESRVLVVHDAAEAGKSALLEHVRSSAAGLRVLRAVGVGSEMDLPFATPHQLCVPLLDRPHGLPTPRRGPGDCVRDARGLLA
jgi:hypothetical protein